MFHKHTWKEIARTYAPTMIESGLIEYLNGNVRMSPVMINGQTTILWECEDCHEREKEEMLGKEIK